MSCFFVVMYLLFDKFFCGIIYNRSVFMDNRKEDVLKYWDKKESREKLGKFFGGVIFVFFVFFTGFYMLDLYMGA